MDECRDYRRVEQAIRFLAARRPQRPALAEVAAHVGLSPHHFQRLFRRWAGTSPKRFLQHLTAADALRRLRAERTVLETALDTGLSSTGRLHDLLVSVHAVTPGEVRRLGAGLEIRHGVHPTPFGPARIAVTARGIVQLAFLPDARDEAADLAAAWPHASLREDAATASAWMRRVFGPAGDRVPLLLRGTNLQLQVWQALLRIPPGAVVSYGGLAAALGRPRAARAVAGAVARNPVAWLIPCHRVLRASGALGGYRWGTPRKRAMLAREAAAAEKPVSSTG